MEDKMNTVRERLLQAEKPLFFFDDDPDGLCAFLLLYRLCQKGKGVVIKSAPELNESFARKVEEYAPDLVFILDKPLVSQEFLDKTASFGVPVIWIDHHPPQKRAHVEYYNPRVWNDRDNRPTSYWAWRIAQDDHWIAGIGMVGDWHLIADLHEKISSRYPELLPPDIVRPEDALFRTTLGKLVRIIAFNLKGRITEVNASIKVLTRIESPHEILDQTSARGKYLYKKYEKINSAYLELLHLIPAADGPVVFYSYLDNKMSFTSEISNELLYKHPDKIIFICREKSGEMKCSIRSAQVVIAPLLHTALQGVEGYGGGHDLACGACIKKKHFEKFFAAFSKLVADAKSELVASKE